ncbi:MAG: serine/threonine protein kinase [Planctomycetes bacterium]|nr:serine/threonine protein kinase [Planctomycetota bacterium]
MDSTSEKSIFLNALDYDSTSERDTYLNRACAGNPGLRAEINDLLAAHFASGNPLDGPEQPAGAPSPAAFAETAVYASGPESPGTVIGNYRLMEQIGEGGFGMVFVAEQLQPVRRKVALKLIKPGMDSRDVIARFEAERQALALMDHPNIARVFDAGTTDSGRPYFVMELVRGVPITEFCDSKKLSLPDRLELFLHLCEAVQHAHLKGIIHRDLKPSNVLVTSHDTTYVVKAIDFGIAKAIGQSLTEKTIYTRFAQLLGTPLYMSPEQAEMSGLDIDTRCDIYSLGVLLYELVVGATPFDRQRLESASFDEIRRIIREEEPPRPSSRFSTLGNSVSTIASNRRLEPRRISAFVRGDLDWIVMKALDKDRNRRYETCSSLAADVRRFIANEPVEARPPSVLYRLQKFSRRNKVAITTGSLVLLALTLGTVISVWQAARAISEKNEKVKALQEAVTARNAAIEAKKEADAARQEIEQFADRLKQANVFISSGRAHADSGRWSAANTDYTRATELQPQYFNTWMERSSLYLRLGVWNLAAADLARAVELGASLDNPATWGLPQLFLYTGDVKNSHDVCRKMLGSGGGLSGETPLPILRSCLIVHPDEVNYVDLAKRTEEAFANMAGGPMWMPGGGRRRPNGGEPQFSPGGGPGPGPRDERRRPDEPRNGAGRGREGMPGRPPRGGGPGPRGIALYLTGLAHYRAGEFEKSATQLADLQTNDPDWVQMFGPGAQAALALAQFALGDQEHAQASLAAAERLTDKWTERRLDDSVGQAPGFWLDWIEAQLLCREARLVIKGGTPVADPRLRTLEQRALNQLRGEE